MLRSLIWFWRMNLAVIAGSAVATAVLTGALIIGDSVRGSLRSLTLDRLGGVDVAAVGERPVSLDLIDRVQASETSGGAVSRVAPALTTGAAAVHAESRALAAGVSLWGVDERFADLFGAEVEFDFQRRDGQAFPSLVINQALAHELGAAVGDAVLLSFASHSDIPRESLLGSSDPDDLIDRVRYQIVDVVANRGVGSFGLQPHQAQPLNAFADLSQLGRAMGAEGRFNVLLAGGSAGAPVEVEYLASGFAAALEPADAGLRLTPEDDFLGVDSDEYVLRAPLVAIVERLAGEEGAEVQPLLTYLANSIRVGEREIPYSTVTALSVPVDRPFGRLLDPAGDDVAELREDQILLGDWAAQDLAAGVGDEVELSYFAVGVGDDLETRAISLEVAGVVRREGLAADRTLTPEFPGISDADRMSAWDPPFPVDLQRVRPEDEEYWEDYRGTPKAFVSLETGKRLWGNRFGEVSALRVGRPEAEGDDFDRRFSERLAAELGPESLGYRLLAVKRRGLEASSGASDFGGLFLAFSFVLIASAALLVGLLYRLTVERRVKEVGLRLALGFTGRSVVRTLLAEGAVLAAIGAVLGCGLAVIYARLMLRGIGSWWSELISASLLELHVSSTSLIAGGAGSVLLVMVTLWLAIRRLQRAPTRVLLAGGSVGETGVLPARRWLILGLVLGAAAVALIAISSASGATSNPALFFLVAAALLGCGLTLFAAWCRGAAGGLGPGGWSLLPSMAAHNSSRSPGRSLLSVVLVACASFLLVSLEAVRKDSGQLEGTLDSGTGGFQLTATSDVPLRHDLGSSEALADLGFSPPEIELLGAAGYYPLRLLPGEDASCLNLYQPEKPRILGAPTSFVERGGFTFHDQLGEAENPWSLLDQQLEPGVIPAIGDYASTQWILHLGLGDEVVLTDDRGEPVRLRLVALLEGSIFQSELLVSERNFLRHFPSRGGYGYLLVESPVDKSAEVRSTLEAGLGQYGLDVTSAPEKLASFHAVENTYLTTFQVLGGLGLLLGTLGLAVVMVRNTLERRGELAALRAFGFRRSTLAWMVLLENAFLLAVGLGIGAVSGLAAVMPHLVAGTAEVPWSSLVGTLGGVLVTGLLAGAVAVVMALKTQLLPVLKAD